jgi:RNA polymerase sigma-70 factor (ECF subfamily)
LPTSAEADPLSRLVACGAAQHPGVAEPAALRPLLAARLAEGARGLEARAADLYLATACVAGDAAAIAALDATLGATLRPALARLGVPAFDHDDVVQRVRVAMLVGEAARPPGLAGYTGRGELRAYLRSAAVRIAMFRRAREAAAAPPPSDPEVPARLADAADSPELRMFKQRCGDDLRGAFAAALASLRPRERTLLRQHYVDGLTIDQLGQLHQVHRSTCARWIEGARVKVLRRIRGHLRDTLGLDHERLESAVALVRSQLDLSLSPHLASRPAAT